LPRSLLDRVQTRERRVPSGYFARKPDHGQGAFPAHRAIHLKARPRATTARRPFWAKFGPARQTSCRNQRRQRQLRSVDQRVRPDGFSARAIAPGVPDWPRQYRQCVRERSDTRGDASAGTGQTGRYEASARRADRPAEEPGRLRRLTAERSTTGVAMRDSSPRFSQHQVNGQACVQRIDTSTRRLRGSGVSSGVGTSKLRSPCDSTLKA